MKLKKPVLLISSFVVTFLAGFAGSAFTTSKISTWYSTLTKPSFNPPNSIFSPVWTTLYILMAIALYLVWREGYKKKNVKAAVKVFFIQLVFNAAWSIVFFGLENVLGAFIILLSLWLMILYTISRFAKVNKWASYLLYPYLAWVSFAGLLNFTIWQLNK